MTIGPYQRETNELNAFYTNLKAGMTWSDVAAQCKTDLNISIFDKNGDTIVQDEEINYLKKLANSLYAFYQRFFSLDKLIHVINLAQNIQDGKVEEDKLKLAGTITIKKGDKFKNFTYYEDNRTAHQKRQDTARGIEYDGNILVDYTELNNLEPGEYYISSYKRVKNDDGTYTEFPVISKKIGSDTQKSANHSEGFDRKLSNITIALDADDGREKTIRSELTEICKQLGINLNILSDTKGYWIEDYAVIRSDGKICVVSYEAVNAVSNSRAYEPSITADMIDRRRDISTTTQGGGIIYGEGFDNYIQEKDIVYSKSYLEGGNVLNTCLANGEAAAVIGSDSITFTLMALNLENTEENIEIAKKQIAEDLGIEQENITFIPQFDFHIDMLYRPLHNGEIAVPDFQESIKLLEENEISSMSAEEKQELINELKVMDEKTASIRQEAEQTLEEKGYKLHKIPCFDKCCEEVNYLNGVSGTSESGEVFYITNKSKYPELDTLVQDYFQKAGADKIFFVSTTSFLRQNGGIDCLTLEM